MATDRCKRRLNFSERDQPSPFLSPATSPVLPTFDLSRHGSQDPSFDPNRLSRSLTLMAQLFPVYPELFLYSHLQACGYDLLVAMEALMVTRDSMRHVVNTCTVPVPNWGSVVSLSRNSNHTGICIADPYSAVTCCNRIQHRKVFFKILLWNYRMQSFSFILKSSHGVLCVKPWLNRLASRRKFWTCVQLAFRLATHLRGLATPCVDLR